MQPMAVTSPQEECRVGTYHIEWDRPVSNPIEMSLTVP